MQRRSRAYLVSSGQFEYDVLADGGSSTIGTLFVPPLFAKFCPFFALSNCVFYNRFLERPLDLASDLYAFDQVTRRLGRR